MSVASWPRLEETSGSESLANSDQLSGSFPSIDPRGTDTLVIPQLFAAGGGQPSTLAGRVQLYSAQSPPFVNAIHNPTAGTASFTGVSNPLVISINIYSANHRIRRAASGSPVGSSIEDRADPFKPIGRVSRP